MVTMAVAAVRAGGAAVAVGSLTLDDRARPPLARRSASGGRRMPAGRPPLLASRTISTSGRWPVCRPAAAGSPAGRRLLAGLPPRWPAELPGTGRTARQPLTRRSAAGGRRGSKRRSPLMLPEPDACAPLACSQCSHWHAASAAVDDDAFHCVTSDSELRTPARE